MTPRRPPILALGLLLAFALLGAVLWFALRDPGEPTTAQVHADFSRVLTALEAWRAQHAGLPEEGDLAFLVPEHLDAVPLDPWGRPYLYASDGQRAFLQTLGRDGVRGGAGPDQDHTNHDGHR